MLTPPDGSEWFRLAGAASVVYWVVGTVTGGRPDGGLLGFSAGMFAVWSAMRRDDERDRRGGDDRRSPGRLPPRADRRRVDEPRRPPRRRKPGEKRNKG